MDSGEHERQEDAIEYLFKAFNWSEDEDNVAHFRFFLRCMEIRQSRDSKYHGAWKRFGALNNLVRAATKCERLLSQFWYGPSPVPDPDGQTVGGPPDLDDAPDAANFLAFFVIQAERGEWKKEKR